MRRIDLPTIVALSALAWLTLIVSHELLGHGIASYLVGGRLVYFDAMYAEYAPPPGGMPFWAGKFVTSAGTLVNVLMAVGAMLWFARMPKRQSWLGFFLWIFILFSLFQSGCYVAFSQYIYRSMDWHKFLIDLEPRWAWSAVEIVVGAAMIGLGIFYARRHHYTFLDAHAPLKIQKTMLLVVPWLTATVVATAAGMVVPTDSRGLVILGAVGNSFNFLMWMPLLALLPSRPDRALRTVALCRHWAGLVSGVILTLVFIFVIGRGIHFAG